MSHIVKIETRIRDQAALKAACVRLGLETPVTLTEDQPVVFFDKTTFSTGQSVRLPGWSYPVVVATDGTLAFDNFGGRWGDCKQLDRLRQTYAVEVATREATARGWRVRELLQSDGSIRLQLTEVEGVTQ